MTNKDSQQHYILPVGYIPQAQDILCGKSKESFNHVGNRRFRVTISLYLKQYNSLSSRSERGDLIASIVEMIYLSGGQFLVMKNNRWVTLPTRKARSKVGHALRDASAHQQLASPTRTRAIDDVNEPSNSRNKRQRTIEPLPVPSDADVFSVDDLLECCSNENGTLDDSAQWSLSQLDFLVDDSASSTSSESSNGDDLDFLGLIEKMNWDSAEI